MSPTRHNDGHASCHVASPALAAGRKVSDIKHHDASIQHPESLLRWLRNLVISSAVLHVSYRYLVYSALEKGLTSYGSGAAITQICLVWVMIFAGAVVLTRKLPALLRFDRRDLAFAFLFLFISGPLMLGTVYFTRMTTYAYYHGDKRPETKAVLEQNLPRLAPDDEAVRSIYRGSPDGAVPWKDWVRRTGPEMPPAVAWGIYTLLFLGIAFSVVFFFSRRWLEEEQLAFPLARVGELLVEGRKDPATGKRLPLLTTKAFWAGFILTFLFQVCTYLSPGLEHRVGSFYIPETTPVLGGLDFPARQFWWRPVFVAMFFLCPRQILGSALFFHLLQCVFIILGNQMGYKGFTGSVLPGASAFPFKPDQLVGASIALSVIMLWLSRKHLRAQIADLWSWARRRPATEASRRPLAMLALLISVAGFMLWTLLIGFSVRTAVMFLGCLLLAMIINTRGRAETGMPMIVVFSSFSPFEFVSILGTKLMGLGSIAATAVHGWLFWNNVGSVTPSLMDSLKMGQILRRSYKWVCATAAAAVVIGIALGFVTVFDSAYSLGINRWVYQYGSGGFECATAYRLMQQDAGFNWLHAGFAMGGAAIVTLTWACRALFPGFALHPMGYLLSLHSGLHHFSLSLMIAYVVKSLSIHYGGMRTYAAMVPFFVGLMAGQIVGGVFAGLLNAVFGTTVYVPMF